MNFGYILRISDDPCSVIESNTSEMFTGVDIKTNEIFTASSVYKYMAIVYMALNLYLEENSARTKFAWKSDE